MMVQQIIRFSIVGTIGFVLNALLVELLARMIGPLYAQLMAFPVVATVTWYLNRHYTFGASEGFIGHEWMRYVFANTLGWIVNNGIYIFLVLRFLLAARHPSIAVAAGSLAGMGLNFMISRLVVFKKSGHARFNA